MKRHVFGMSAEEVKSKVKRVLESIGFWVMESESEILAEKGRETVRVVIRSSGKGYLNIPQTEVVFECEEEVYRTITEKLRLSRMGG